MTQPVESLIVVGASLAGLRAVEAARKAGFRGRIELIGAEPELPYDRPPLSKAFLEEAGEVPAVPTFREEQYLREELGVTLTFGAPATGLDLEARAVDVDGSLHPFDALVIATGSTLRTLPGTEALAGVHGLRTASDAIAVRSALDAGARTVVVGAGFIGSEVASGAAKRGLDVTIVEAAPQPLVRAVGAEMGPAVAHLHALHGTELRCGVGVEAIEGDGRAEAVRLTDGTVLPADLVVVGIGVDPATSWLEGSGLELDNGVVCDERLWTGVPGVYAAGDVAHWVNPVFGVRQRMENWTAAAEQGAAAARNLLDPNGGKAYGTVPYFWSDWYGSRIQFVGQAQADEIRLVEGDPEVGGRWTALYRAGDRLIGALTMNGQTDIMKYRVMIGRSTSWDDALTFAAERRAKRAEAALAS